MPDTSLGRALAELVDDVEAGDSLRERVERRERRGWRRPRLLAVAAVLVVIALVGGVLAVVNRDDARKTPVVTKPDPYQPTEFNPRADGGSWTPIAPVPSTVKAGAVSVWTGREVLFWGGADPLKTTPGSAYDPATDAWRTLPPAPIAPDRSGTPFTWTGTELIVWGGYLTGSRDVQRSGSAEGGAAFSPTTNEWRILPEAPIAPRSGAAFAWTGSEFVVWGGIEWMIGDGEPTKFGDGAAYNPATDQWHLLPDLDLAPGEARGASQGTAFVVRTVDDDKTARVFLDGSGRVESMASAPRRFRSEGPLIGDDSTVYSWGFTDRPTSTAEREFLGWWKLAADGSWKPIRGNESSITARDAGLSGTVHALRDGFLAFPQHLRYSANAGEWLRLPHSGLPFEGCCVAVVDTGEALLVWSDPSVPGSRYQPPAAAHPEGGDQNAYPDGFAIWPVVDPDELDSYRSQRSLPTSASDAATSFAREVLGWPEATASVTQAWEADGLYLLTITAAQGDGEIAVRGISPNEFVVTRVYTFPVSETQADSGGFIAMIDGEAEIRFAADPPPGGSVEIVLRKRADEWRQTDLPTASMKFFGVDTNYPGAVIVLYRDAAGVVVDAWGVAVPAGEYYVN
jgi:hypothetical protein